MSTPSRALCPPFDRNHGSPFRPHPRHRKRPLRSSTFAARLSPTLNSASGVSSATWWQAAQPSLAKSPEQDPLWLPGGAAWPTNSSRRRSPGSKDRYIVIAMVDLRTDDDGKRLGHCRTSVMRLLDAFRTYWPERRIR